VLKWNRPPNRERNRKTSDGGGKRVSGHKLGCRLRFLFSHFSSPHLLFLLQSFSVALLVSSQQTSDSNWIPYDSGSWIYVDTERPRYSPSLNSSGISRRKTCVDASIDTIQCDINELDDRFNMHFMRRVTQQHLQENKSKTMFYSLTKMSEFFNRFISGLIYKIVKSDEKM